MSTLWVQAAWHNAQPGTEEWSEHGFGHETREQRRDRYIQHVQDVHGVDHDTAQRALQHVARHLKGDAPQVSPTEYGFASAPHFGREVHLPDSIFFGNIWEHAPLHVVRLDRPVHASQWFITPRNVAHNLFHPGKRMSLYDDEDHGHPDIEPTSWDPEEEDDDDFDNNGPSDCPRMIRQTDGTHMAIDGHHRLATDMLLRKPKTRARVLDIRDFGGRGSA